MRTTGASFDDPGVLQPSEAVDERSSRGRYGHQAGNRFAAFRDNPLTPRLNVAQQLAQSSLRVADAYFARSLHDRIIM